MIQSEDIVKLLIAMALGGMIGLEREIRDKAAGLRTLMFISAGSALFTIFSMRISQLPGLPQTYDPARIAAQIVTGVGFIGAGVIMRERGEIHGLTTAAMIWLVAGLGMGVGLGEYLFSVIAAVFILLVLFVFPYLEGVINNHSRTDNYEIHTKAGLEKFTDLKKSIAAHQLKIRTCHRGRDGDVMVYKFVLAGRPLRHDSFVQDLLTDPDIINLN